jgi:hypothetical protein
MLAALQDILSLPVSILKIIDKLHLRPCPVRLPARTIHNFIPNIRKFHHYYMHCKDEGEVSRYIHFLQSCLRPIWNERRWFNNGLQWEERGLKWAKDFYCQTLHRLCEIGWKRRGVTWRKCLLVRCRCCDGHEAIVEEHNRLIAVHGGVDFVVEI